MRYQNLLPKPPSVRLEARFFSHFVWLLFDCPFFLQPLQIWIQHLQPHDKRSNWCASIAPWRTALVRGAARHCTPVTVRAQFEWQKFGPQFHHLSRWCIWLSRPPNTRKVGSSILSRDTNDFFFGLLFLFRPHDLFVPFLHSISFVSCPQAKIFCDSFKL